MDTNLTPGYQETVRSICSLAWETLSREELTDVAWAYYYFSIQFRESLEGARRAFPEDDKLAQLEREECKTANLSPWPGVALPDEEINHDEFMRRCLALDPIDNIKALKFRAIGHRYLGITRELSDGARGGAIASYEDGGLTKVFEAMLSCPIWQGVLLEAFEHFLTEHIRFDSNSEQGHGALSRHIAITDEVRPFWEEFRLLLVSCVPALLREQSNAMDPFDGVIVNPEDFPIAAHIVDQGAQILESGA